MDLLHGSITETGFMESVRSGDMREIERGIQQNSFDGMTVANTTESAIYSSVLMNKPTVLRRLLRITPSFDWSLTYDFSFDGTISGSDNTLFHWMCQKGKMDLLLVLFDENINFDESQTNSLGDDCQVMWDRVIKSPKFEDISNFISDERKLELRNILTMGSIAEIKEEFTEINANILFERHTPQEGFSPLTVVMAERIFFDKSAVIEHLLKMGANAQLDNFYDANPDSMNPQNALEYAFHLTKEPDVIQKIIDYSTIRFSNGTCRDQYGIVANMSNEECERVEWQSSFNYTFEKETRYQYAYDKTTTEIYIDDAWIFKDDLANFLSNNNYEWSLTKCKADILAEVCTNFQPLSVSEYFSYIFWRHSDGENTVL